MLSKKNKPEKAHPILFLTLSASSAPPDNIILALWQATEGP